MSYWQIILSKQAQKDAKNLAAAKLKPKALKLLQIISENPYQNPPEFEKLGGDLAGLYARRINRQHRLVYEILKDEYTVRIIRMWTPYE